MPQEEQKGRRPLWKRVLLRSGIVLGILAALLVIGTALLVYSVGLLGPHAPFIVLDPL